MSARQYVHNSKLTLHLFYFSKQIHRLIFAIYSHGYSFSQNCLTNGYSLTIVSTVSCERYAFHGTPLQEIEQQKVIKKTKIKYEIIHKNMKP